MADQQLYTNAGALVKAGNTKGTLAPVSYTHLTLPTTPYV